MYTQKNVTHLFISPGTFAADTADAPSVARQIGVKVNGETLCIGAINALADTDQFKILYLNAKGEIVTSPTFDVASCLSGVKVTPAALAPQISHIGFNGTDGDIVETSSGNYLVSLGLKDIGKMIGNKRLYKFGEYTAPITAIKSDIAINLAGSLQLNQSKDAWVRVIPAAICSSVDPLNLLDGDLTVVNGSKYVVFAAGATDYGGAIPFAVGDFLRIGTVGAGNGATDPVYKVVELTAADTLKLDRAVTNASGLYLDASVDAEAIPAATALLPATLWGVQLTGNDANAPFKVGMFGANLVYFSVGVSTDFQTTQVRLTQTPSFGQGTYKQIAQLDWELQGNGREKYRIAEYPVTFVPNIPSTETPAFVYNFKFQPMETDSLPGPVVALQELILVSTGAPATAAIDAVFANLL